MTLPPPIPVRRRRGRIPRRRPELGVRAVPHPVAVVVSRRDCRARGVLRPSPTKGKVKGGRSGYSSGRAMRLLARAYIVTNCLGVRRTARLLARAYGVWRHALQTHNNIVGEDTFTNIIRE